jgi:hypothetical protein
MWRVLRDCTDEAAVVLRLIGEYRVVGDSYVNGIMGGEAVENFDWDKELEVVDLI